VRKISEWEYFRSQKTSERIRYHGKPTMKQHNQTHLKGSRYEGTLMVGNLGVSVEFQVIHAHDFTIIVWSFPMLPGFVENVTLRGLRNPVYCFRLLKRIIDYLLHCVISKNHDEVTPKMKKILSIISSPDTAKGGIESCAVCGSTDDIYYCNQCILNAMPKWSVLCDCEEAVSKCYAKHKQHKAMSFYEDTGVCE